MSDLGGCFKRWSGSNPTPHSFPPPPQTHLVKILEAVPRLGIQKLGNLAIGACDIDGHMCPVSKHTGGSSSRSSAQRDQVTDHQCAA